MEKVFVGKIVNTHGIKGEIKIKSDFERKADAFKVGNFLIINNNSYEINSYRVHKGYDLITLKGFDNINQVLSFKGLNVYTDRSNFKLKDNDYLLNDLIGMQVICDKELGVVDDYTNDDNPLLIIKGKKNFYIPIKGNFIKKVDMSNRKLYVSDETLELII